MERYVIRGGRQGYERLQLLAQERWPDTSALFHRVGMEEGMVCLDLGCGSGAVTLKMAKWVGPAGRVTGLDMDETKLSLAREVATQQGLGNVEFRAGNVNDWGEPEAYDVVYSRFLLQHLSRAVDLIRRMWAGVRPGGSIVAEDADFDGWFCHPPNAGFEFFLRTYGQVIERWGGDHAVGRKLHGCFLEAGIPHPGVRLVQALHCSDPGKALALTTLEATADAIIAECLASEREVNEAVASLSEFSQDPDTLIGGPRVFQLWARR